jgi:hypothetical protein
MMILRDLLILLVFVITQILLFCVSIALLYSSAVYLWSFLNHIAVVALVVEEMVVYVLARRLLLLTAQLFLVIIGIGLLRL